MPNTKLLLLALLVLAGVISRSARAQALSGTMVGTVVDKSGAMLAGASVRLKNTGTGFARETVTNASGQFSAPTMPIGLYVLTVEKTGFGTLVREGVELTAADTITLNFILAVGDVKQTVEITSSAPLLEAQSAEVSQLVDNKRIVELPLNGRTFTSLVLLTPGAHAGSSSLGRGPYSLRANVDYSVNGSTAASNSYLIDGLYNRNLWLNTLIIVPTIDSIQEFRVLTSNYSAEYGAAAGAVTLVQTKSGTNQLHGSAYEFLRNDKLDANQFFNNRAGTPRPRFRRNEFGAAAGAPIRRDKTFVFADYQGIRLAQPESITSTIPSVAQRNMILTGDFSGLGTTIYDPLSAPSGSPRKAFAGNIIPASRLDPAALKVAALLPLPNTLAATRNFLFNPTLTQQTDQFDARIDQNLGASDRIFGKYSFDNSTQLNPGLLPAPANSSVPLGPYLSADGNQPATSVPLRNQSFTLDYTRVLSPRVINEARAGVVRWNIGINPVAENLGTASALGIPGINIDNRSGGLPGMTITGFAVIGDSSSFPETSQMTIFQYDDAVTLIRGNHTLKFGGQFLRDRFNGFSEFPARGTYTFTGQFTRQAGSNISNTALADFALGAPTTVTRGILQGEFGMRFWELSGFGQDSWRVTNRLTLNYGLRYEVFAPPVEVHDHWANFNINTAMLELAGKNGNSRALRRTDYRDFAPRLGLAYMLTRDQKTVLRSGFGISYVEPAKGGGQLYKNLPYFYSQVINSDQNGAPPVYLQQGLGAPVPPDPSSSAQLSSGNPIAWNEGLTPSRVLQWSIGVQRQLMQNLLLDVAYVGSRSLDLPGSYNYNQAFPGAGAQGPRQPLYKINPLVNSVTYNTGYGSAKYHSLQVKVEKRYSAGLTLSLAYTYASFLSDIGNINGGGTPLPQDARCFNCNWGPTPDDLKHVLVVNHSYQVPFGSGQRYLSQGWIGHVLGSWTLNGIWSVNSGQRFTPTLATGVSNSAGGGPERPNRIADGSLPSDQRTIDRWFDTTAFVAAPQFTFGNSGTGVLTGPGRFNVDFGLHRDFPLFEHYKLSFRGEMFNAFNHPNFGVPNSTIGNAQAGQISGTDAARVIQLALKFVF